MQERLSEDKWYRVKDGTEKVISLLLLQTTHLTAIKDKIKVYGSIITAFHARLIMPATCNTGHFSVTTGGKIRR